LCSLREGPFSYLLSCCSLSHICTPNLLLFLLPQLLLAFDYGDIEEFQQYFSLLDVDNSGDLSGKEIRVLLKALDIQVRKRVPFCVVSILFYFILFLRNSACPPKGFHLVKCSKSLYFCHGE